MGRYAIMVVMSLTFGLIAYNHGMVTSTLYSKAETTSEFNRSQARFIAMSVAEIAIQRLNDEDDDVFTPSADDTISVPANGFENWGGVGGQYRVLVINSGDSLLSMQAEGLFNETTYTVNVSMEFATADDTWEPDLSKAVFAGETINLQGSARIRGHVATNSTAVNGVRMQWSTKIDSSLTIGPGGNPATVVNRANPAGNIGPQGIKVGTSVKTHPMPVYPAYPDIVSSVAPWTVEGASTVTMNPAQYSGKYVPSISVSASGRLNIQTNNVDQVIHTNSLSIAGSGRIIVLGTGRVTLYVVNTFSIAGSATVNHTRAANTLLMYYGGASMSVSGSTAFRGDVFAERANITLTGSGGFQGHIITGGTAVTVTGSADAHSRVIYAPNATVSMTGSGRVTGTIVARHYLGSGSSDVYFATGLDESIPPLKISGGGGGGGGPRVRVRAFY